MKPCQLPLGLQSGNHYVGWTANNQIQFLLLPVGTNTWERAPWWIEPPVFRRGTDWLALTLGASGLVTFGLDGSGGDVVTTLMPLGPDADPFSVVGTDAQQRTYVLAAAVLWVLDAGDLAWRPLGGPSGILLARAGTNGAIAIFTEGRAEWAPPNSSAFEPIATDGHTALAAEVDQEGNAYLIDLDDGWLVTTP